jgi:dihydroorotate dehydrogenase
MYTFLRNLMFQLEPEKAHYFAMNSLQMGCRFAPIKKIIQQNCSYNHPKLEKKLWG